MANAGRSGKTAVIEYIFDSRFDPSTGRISDLVVTFDQISDAITTTAADLSTNNLANFWKDLTRSPLRNENWPRAVFDAGFTGGDAIGAGDRACFSFVEVLPGQTLPFEDTITLDRSTVLTHTVQSLSMSRAMKGLGRPGENWLAQVAAHLHVVETHFALFSTRAVLEVAFLQTNVKMRRGEVDAAFSVVEGSGQWLLSAEAKGMREPIHLPQIARAAFNLDQAARSEPEQLSSVVGVIPFAMKIVGDSEIWTVEFEPVETAESPLVVAAQGLIKLVPAVPGIS